MLSAANPWPRTIVARYDPLQTAVAVTISYQVRSLLGLPASNIIPPFLVVVVLEDSTRHAGEEDIVTV